METRTLLLNMYFEPQRIITWHRAMHMLVAGKVEVIEEFNMEVRSTSCSFQIPAVVRLMRHVKPIKGTVKFSRKNVFQRDSYCCQYCGTRLRSSMLNYDHVVPRHAGGRTVWENIVAACYPCNTKKANRTPVQAGMRLLKQPYRPKSLPLIPPEIIVKSPPPEWERYLHETQIEVA